MSGATTVNDRPRPGLASGRPTRRRRPDERDHLAERLFRGDGGLRAKPNDAGIGTIVALMMPCAIVLLVVWTLLLMLWYQFGIPLGPS